uniref:Katanin p80 subunit B-like 1 n=2 Tax=Gadus morhua TaxID=8049 RepID=A0A8C5C336_GADMO
MSYCVDGFRQGSEGSCFNFEVSLIMAAGDYDERVRQYHDLNHNLRDGHLRPNLHIDVKENMKQVDFLNKEALDNERYQVNHSGSGRGKAKRVSSVKRKGLPSTGGKLKLRCQAAPVADQACDSGMANKENELASSEDMWGGHYNDKCAHPLTTGEASKMAGVGSKCSDAMAQLSKDHEAMSHVLFGRSLRLNVALTLWRRNASEFVAYLIRIQDPGVLLDCLPMLTKNLQDEATCISLGCCVDLLPQVKVILASTYEEHLIIGLHWVQSVIRKWLPELSTSGKSLPSSCSEERWVLSQRATHYTMEILVWFNGTHFLLIWKILMCLQLEQYLTWLKLHSVFV